MNIRHSSFISSKGDSSADRGWYTTKKDKEEIVFDRPVNSLVIESGDKPLAIQVNNLEDIWYVSSNTQEGLEGLRIYSITVLEDASTKIKWKALTY